MFAFLDILSKIVQLLPILDQLVMGVEQIHGAGNGAQKLNTVLTTVQGAIEGASAVGATFDQMKPALTNAVNGIVATYKAAGGIPVPATQVSGTTLPAASTTL